MMIKSELVCYVQKFAQEFPKTFSYLLAMLFMLLIMLVLCSNITTLLKHVVNVLLGHIEQFYSSIQAECFIREYHCASLLHLLLFWHIYLKEAYLLLKHYKFSIALIFVILEVLNVTINDA